MSAISKKKLGLIAGNGNLPIILVEALQQSGRDFFVVSFSGDCQIENTTRVNIGTVTDTARVLREAQCEEIFLIGGLTRPNLAALKLDEGGQWVINEWSKQQAGGDDALLRLILRYFEEKEGFAIADPFTLLAPLLGQAGVQGAVSPIDLEDITLGMGALKTLASLDIGQAVVVSQKRIIAVEGAEGTDGLLARITALPEAARGIATKRAGVLVKAPKAAQDLRVDLPTIGVRTIELAAAAHLEGIAYAAGLTLFDNRTAMIKAADKFGVFLVGLES